MNVIVSSIEREYRRYKGLGERALDQVADDELLSVPSPEGNSVVTLVWHLSGNLTSRFTDFLTSDGEKPWRDRESEFVPREVTRAQLRARWNEGWAVLFTTLSTLKDESLGRRVTIRGEGLTVLEALHRSLAHASYHVGQIVLLAKSFRGAGWQSLSIPKGGIAVPVPKHSLSEDDRLPRPRLLSAMNILDAIGNTSIVRLRKVVPPDCADIFVKLEWENPTGSVKDRMAHAVIARAEADGRLRRGDTVIEYTGGSTGTSLALVCAAKGYPIHIVSSDAFSQEKLDHMAALGAELTLVPSEGGMTTRKLILDMIEAARKLSQEPHTYWTDQLNNQDSIAGYFSLGEEIWSQTEGKVDAFVHCVGTGASSRGVATVLKRHNPKVRIVVVEPAESSVLLGGQAGPHKIEGVGIGYAPPLWEPTLVDEILPVKTEDAKAMTRRLAREEALFAGTSSGANVVAAIQVAERLGPGAKVVTLMADSGLKYLSTDVYRSG